MKTKTLKFSLLTAVLGIALWSCKKDIESPTTPTDKINPSAILSQEVKIEFTDNESVNKMTSGDFAETINWVRTSSANNFSANVVLSENLPNEVEITAKTLTSLTYKYNNDSYTMSNVTINGNVFEATITGQNNNPVDFKITDNSGQFNYAYNNLEVLDIIDVTPSLSNSSACPWCVVWGAAALISAGVDYYCGIQQAKAVDACTAKGKCSKLEPCGATCITCPEP